VTTDNAPTLASLRRGDRAVVVAVDDDGDRFGDTRSSTIARRLLELGFVPGAALEVVATMWPGDDPLAVRIGGSTFALRRHEARAVRVRDAAPRFA
jgi:Fe2+ transport system protein FeoA